MLWSTRQLHHSTGNARSFFAHAPFPWTGLYRVCCNVTAKLMSAALRSSRWQHCCSSVGCVGQVVLCLLAPNCFVVLVPGRMLFLDLAWTVDHKNSLIPCTSICKTGFVTNVAWTRKHIWMLRKQCLHPSAEQVLSRLWRERCNIYECCVNNVCNCTTNHN